MSGVYVHGYSAQESERLTRQANILSGFIHAHALFAPGSRVLEAGCGVGAQTIQLAARNPQVRFVAIDRSEESLAIARGRVDAVGIGNVEFRRADINSLPFTEGEFDAAFLCFILEHLSEPHRALLDLRRILKPGARLHAFEGDHGSVVAWPDDAAIGPMVAAISKLQALEGGDACLGRKLCPLLTGAGFQQVTVEPCVAYADATRPNWVEEFTKATITEVFQSQRDGVLARGLLGERAWQAGMDGMHRAAQEGATFSYTFYRGTGYR